MKLKTLTSPFTGLDFKAFEIDDMLIFHNPISNEKITLKVEDGNIMLPLDLCEHVEIVNTVEAANILCVSRQRIREIVQNETLQSFNIAGQTFFKFDDVLEYRRTRKAGRPRKVK